MGERLIKPYEISVWEDKLIQDGATYRFEENKLAVIGSDTMTGLNKVYDPVFNKKTNGERTLTFSLRYKYFDPYSGNSDFINPFAALLVNERKVKLHYDNKWYEFIIKDHTESSDGLEWTYSCTDAFVLELSKTGYNLTFDSELNNNQGTAGELGEKVLENTEWQFGGADTFKQLIAEPIYKAQLVDDTDIEIINASNNTDPVPTPTADIYVFYSYVKNQNGKFVQFIIRDDNRDYVRDDNNVITDTNFRVKTELIYDATANAFKKGDQTVISIVEIENRFQANRLAYNQLTTYDSVMGRVVDRFTISGQDKEVYRYTDYEYTTSNVVMNYITNGENFNSLEDGTLQGWNAYTDQEYEYNEVKSPGSNNPQEKGWYELVNNEYVLTTDTIVQTGKTYYRKEPKAVKKLELATYPELTVGKSLADLSVLSQVEGYLKADFNGVYKIEDGHIVNTIYNSGIENQARFIHSISKGDKFVFRWRAGKGELGQLTPVKTLGLIIARYDQDAPTRFGYYYKHIKEEDIIVHFVGHESVDTLPTANNIIRGGAIVDGNYVINNVVQTPSTKYLYEVVEEGNTKQYAWKGLTGEFVEASEYMPYYYTIAEARESIPNTVLSNTDTNIGIFIYTTEVPTTTTVGENNETITTIDPIYIQDIQLTRYVKDETVSNSEYPILIGNVPTATSQSIEYYYVQPDNGTAAEDVETYVSPEKLAQRLGIEATSITPKYNESSEKTLSISVSQSNCFNILQTIAETFECWVDLVVDHDERGYITNTNGVLNKYVYLREYVGKDNWAGFKYGINLSSIERNVNSDEIVSKLIVDQTQSEYTDEGFVSIASAPSNPSNESYILNFDYYYNQGLLNKDEVEEEKNAFLSSAADLNRQLQEAEKKRIDLEASLTKLESNRTVYTELIDTAQNNLTEALEQFKQLTGYEYAEFKGLLDDSLDGIPTEEDLEVPEVEDEDNASYVFTLTHTPVVDSDITITIEGISPIQFIGGGKESKTEPIKISYDGKKTFTIKTYLTVEIINFAYVEDINELIEEETVADTLGQLYICSSTINNYSGLLTNINEEYWKIRKELRGSEDYTVKFWKVPQDALNQPHICVDLSDYLIGFQFKIGTGTPDNTWNTYTATISKKYFDIESNATRIQLIAPDGYSIETDTYDIEETVTTVSIESTDDPKEAGIKNTIEGLQNQKDTLTNNFNNKYRRYIQEGTWSSTDYIDSELYYLDALQVSNTSAQPQVTYTINVVEVSELEGLELYNFDAGDKTYVEDTEFFGWSQVNVGTEAQPQYVLTPAREEVIVSEVEWHLDEPENNIITVQNYKTRFEDLFQRISAAVQTVQYNEATYAKISTLLDADGTIKSDVLVNSLNNISGKQYNLTTDGSVSINGNQIEVRNLTNGQNRVIIDNEGIKVSSDGGLTWNEVITGRGVKADTLYSGMLNTDNLIIGNKENPSFRWDKSGISAYKSNITDGYDLKTYVRYDQYGLYGIKDNENFLAQSLDDIKNKAHFAVTWDGFFIKNSYEDGGRVSITSDNDFQVIDGSDTERIKIGSLGIDETTGDRIYGINISDKNGNSVLSTDNDGNLTIEGTIYANAGEIGGMVVNNDWLRMNYIVLEPGVGIYSTYPNRKGETPINPNVTVPPFIISDIDGSATFNDVIVRGSIKTSVFEYEEIQAVGGAFLFRPATSIRTVEVSGQDLIITVEKPLILRDGSWYKFSNYNSQEAADATTITNYGLTHIYQLSIIEEIDQEIEETNTILKLLGAASLLNTVDISDIPGGSIIDMGRHAIQTINNVVIDVAGNDNYGIGINSSDNYINLPPRAISLFETVIHPNDTLKVSYEYRGILGTLPNPLQANIDVDSSIYQHMQGTQGIYTDNMYIGDDSQYVAFYEDSNHNKQLKIKASQIMFEIPDPEPGEDPWKDVADVTQGADGEDAITVRIDSSAGDIFKNRNISSTLTCTVYSGTTDITNQVTNFTWQKKNSDGTIDTSWSRLAAGRTITIGPNDIDSKAIFICTVTF